MMWCACSRFLFVEVRQPVGRQAEYQIHDRLSFQKFTEVTLSDPVSEEKTTLLFREILSQTGKVEEALPSV